MLCSLLLLCPKKMQCPRRNLQLVGDAPGDDDDDTARFNNPHSVVVLPDSGEFVVSDCWNHVLRVVTPGGAVRRLAGSGEPGFADGQGAAARFDRPTGLALERA